MTINGISEAGGNVRTGRFGMNMQMDSVSRNIQNQIADAQKRLQELSSNEDMELEEKMKKRQEIQQEITNLNQQLRQHQIEQRKEQQQGLTSMDDMPGRSRKAAKAGNQENGLSQVSMQAMISADSSRKQANLQGSIAAQMEGRAGVLESEIKMDKSRGASTEKKEEELADLQAKAQALAESQISTLADAGEAMEEAAEAETARDENNTAEKAENNEKADRRAENAEDSSTGNDTATTGENLTAETPVSEPVQKISRSVYYTSIDIRL